MKLSTQEQIAVHALMGAFSADHTHVCLLHRSQGLVMETTCGDVPVILKVMASAHDTADLQARLDWIHYLHENGLNVPRLIASPQGRWIESVEIEGTWYTAYAYERIPLTPDHTIDWRDAAMPPLLGEVMGRMHRLARSYRPALGRPTMRHLQDTGWLQDPATAFHPSQAVVVEPILHLRDTIAQFPKEADIYGLIHDDLHTGNVFRMGHTLAVIDFDCCHHSWFAADLASALLFRVWIGPEKENLTDEAVAFLRGVLQGYRTQHDAPPGWASMLPHFLKLREISLFWSDYAQVDAATQTGGGLFWYLFDSIRQDRPFLDLDIEAVG